MVMQRMDHANQVPVLHIQQAGTIMERLHKCIITILTAINRPQIQDLGKANIYKQFYLQLFILQ
jgi:hypothetical protein